MNDSMRSVMRLVGAAALLLGLLAVPAAAMAQGEPQPMVVAAGQVVDGRVATIGQDIVVDGVVTGDVTSWSGDITVNGSVGGDVVSYAGQIFIGSGGRVGGSVLALGGELRGEPGAAIAGEAIEGARGGQAVASVVDLVVPAVGEPAAPVGVAARVLLGGIFGAFLFAFSLLWTTFWPRRTSAAAQTLLLLAGRSLALGLLSTVILGVLAPPLVALLAASLVGLPLLALLLLLLQVPFVFGLAVLARTLAPGRATAAPPAITGRLAAVAAGLAALIGITTALMPLAGLALFYLLGSPGLGAAVICRGGVAAPRMASHL